MYHNQDIITKRVFMKKVFIIFVMVSCIVSNLFSASAYRGQREFSKHCVKCHGHQDFVRSKTRRQWKKFFAKKGKRLIDIHLKSEKAKKSHKYFKSKRFRKKAKHIRKFLIEYAKDSGRAPVCNN